MAGHARRRHGGVLPPGAARECGEGLQAVWGNCSAAAAVRHM